MFEPITGLRYLSSLEFSALAGIRANDSIMEAPNIPACREVPIPVIKTLSIDLIWLVESVISGISNSPETKFTLPAIALCIASGCSAISFDMKSGYLPF